MLWGHCGPELITDLFVFYCYGEVKRDISFFKSCKDITILPKPAIQPIHWINWHKWFEPKSKENDDEFQKVQYPT